MQWNLAGNIWEKIIKEYIQAIKWTSLVEWDQWTTRTLYSAAGYGHNLDDKKRISYVEWVNHLVLLRSLFVFYPNNSDGVKRKKKSLLTLNTVCNQTWKGHEMVIRCLQWTENATDVSYSGTGHGQGCSIPDDNEGLQHIVMTDCSIVLGLSLIHI